MFIRFGLLFSSLTLVSRIFGFIRDMLFASIFGTTLYADVFTVAFRLPNLFRSIFAEGALSAAFVPIFSKKFAHEGLSKSMRFANTIFVILLASLSVLILLLEIFMPVVIRGIAPGFEADPYKFELAVTLTRIMVPYLFFVSLVAFYSCILNSVNEFFALAFSPILLNIVMIAGLYCFMGELRMRVVYAAWSVFIGGLIQLIVIVRAVVRRHVFPKMAKPDIMCNDVKSFFKNITPAILSSSVSQINIWVGTIIITTIPGAASILYFADRIVQLPISLIGVSIGTVILPTLSKAIRARDTVKTHNLQNRAIEFSLALTLPCLIMLFLFAQPIVFVLFERGAFVSSDTTKTAPVLYMLAFGLPAYVLNKVLVASFFANEKTKIPLKISIFCVILNICGNLLLIKSMQQVGVALSTTVSGWVNFCLLIIVGIKLGIFKLDRLLVIKTLRILGACLVLFIFLYNAMNLISTHIKAAPIITLGSLMTASALVYIIAIFVLKAYSIKEIKELM